MGAATGAHQPCLFLQLALNYTVTAATRLTDTAVTANVTNTTDAVYAMQSLSRFVGKRPHNVLLLLPGLLEEFCVLYTQRRSILQSTKHQGACASVMRLQVATSSLF